MLSLWEGVDQAAMAMKGYSSFPKALKLLEPHHQVIARTLVVGSYPSREKQSVYCTAQTDWLIQMIIIFWNHSYKKVSNFGIKWLKIAVKPTDQ